MLRPGTRRGSLALLLLALSAAFGADTSSWIEQYAQESGAATKACGAQDHPSCREHLLRLLELLDGRADIVYRLAKAEAALGNSSAAMDRLATFSRMGLPFADPAADPAFGSIRSHAEFPAVLSRLKAAREPVSSSRPFLLLPEKDLVAEDIAYDPAGQRFYVSSVRHRKIVAVQKDGKVADFLPEGRPDIWGILALRVDAKNRCLWATTVAMPEALGYSAADKGRSALLRFSLASGALLKRYDLPRDGEHALGDMTVSPAGDVFVSDGLGAVYWVDHARDALEVLIPRGTFRSPQTPALSPDARRLFVPDYSRGISIVDLATKQSRLLGHPANLSLGGIDGLYLAGRIMIAVQNGTAPPRLIRMHLDPGLTRVETWDTLEANWSGLGAPTHGVVVGGDFYFIANSGWDRLADDGTLKPGAVFDPPEIRILPLNAAPKK